MNLGAVVNTLERVQDSPFLTSARSFLDVVSFQIEARSFVATNKAQLDSSSRLAKKEELSDVEAGGRRVASNPPSS